MDPVSISATIFQLLVRLRKIPAGLNFGPGGTVGPRFCISTAPLPNGLFINNPYMFRAFSFEMLETSIITAELLAFAGDAQPYHEPEETHFAGTSPCSSPSPHSVWPALHLNSARGGTAVPLYDLALITHCHSEPEMSSVPTSLSRILAHG